MSSNNPWIVHVLDYAQEHGISYKDALKKARPSYKGGSSKVGGVIRRGAVYNTMSVGGKKKKAPKKKKPSRK